MQNQEQQSEPMDMTALEPTTELLLNLTDEQTKNSTQVRVQLFNKEDQVTLVQQVTEASLKALIALGMVEESAVELKSQIHTITYRKQ